MIWKLLPCPFDGMTIWGAKLGRYQYVISDDHECGLIAASVKGFPNTGQRIDLGNNFDSLDKAKQACEDHYRKIVQ